MKLISCLCQDFVVKVEDKPSQPSASTENPSEATGIAQAPPIAQSSSDNSGSVPLTHQPAETVVPPGPQEAVESQQEEDLANKTERLSLHQESSAGAPAAPIPEPIAAAPPRAVHPPPSVQVQTSSQAPAQSTQATDSPEKPQSFKDKLAAFNRSATSGAGPTPPLKPKPLGASGGVGTWAWKQKQQQAAAEGTAKTGPTDPISTEQQHQAPTPIRETDDSAQHPPPAAASGMSASDAKASIAAGGSLRERMAALAGAGAFGSDKPKGPPPPVGSKPRVWKRPEQPVAAEPALGANEENAGQSIPPVALPHPIAVTFESDRQVAESQRGTEGDEQTAQGEDADEEQKEKERRATIAARMAKLGGRGVMGMPMAMGVPMGGAKPVTRQAEAEHPADADVAPQANTAVESKNTGEESSAATASFGEQPTTSSEASTAPDPFTVPAASIAMPALPRKAGPPRRKPPMRTDTGGSGISAAASPSGTQEGGSAPPLSSDPPREPSSTKASATNPPIQREEIQSPTTEGDDREIPLPKTEEELAKDREFEEAGRGPRGAEGAERAGIALATVGTTDQSVEAGHEEPLVHHQGPVHHERSLPPPPPPVSDDDDDFGEPEDEDAEDLDDDIMKQAGSGELLSRPTDAPSAQLTTDTAQPVDFQPLRSPAPSTGDLPETPIVSQTVFSPPNAPQNLLGLPRDEVEMKRDADSAGGIEDDAPPPPPARSVGDAPDEGERIKPAGPRPLPPSPARILPPVQDNAPMSSLITEQHETPRSEGLEQIAAGAPLPSRQASIRSSSQNGPSQSITGEEIIQGPVQRELGRVKSDHRC